MLEASPCKAGMFRAKSKDHEGDPCKGHDRTASPMTALPGGSAVAEATGAIANSWRRMVGGRAATPFTGLCLGCVPTIISNPTEIAFRMLF